MRNVKVSRATFLPDFVQKWQKSDYFQEFDFN